MHNDTIWPIIYTEIKALIKISFRHIQIWKSLKGTKVWNLIRILHIFGNSCSRCNMVRNGLNKNHFSLYKSFLHSAYTQFSYLYGYNCTDFASVSYLLMCQNIFESVIYTLTRVVKCLKINSELKKKNKSRGLYNYRR